MIKLYVLTGPSVLDVFQTLVKQLRISIEDTLGAVQPSLEDSQKFQNSITKAVGEFAGVLPDYHKPDIMNLINSYMVISGSNTSFDVTGANDFTAEPESLQG